MQSGYPYPQATPPKKGMSGCAIAAIVVGVVVVLIGIAVTVLLVKVWNAIPESDREDFKGFTRETVAAQKAPGTDALLCNELRDAKGQPLR